MAFQSSFPPFGRLRVLLTFWCFLIAYTSEASPGERYIQASEDSVYFLSGRVADSFTGELLLGVDYRVYTPDGKLLTQDCTESVGKGGNIKVNIMDITVPRDVLRLRLVLRKEGYEDKEHWVEVNRVGRREKYVQFQEIIRMRKSPRQPDGREQQVGEATVRATRVKMVMKGDTIVYNADAFQLSEGSMLDALIKQLPGASIDDNGRICVNGRFMSDLLVNGESFFRGDPKIALDNLPAYMVHRIKVYEREPEDAYLRKKRPGEEYPVVMDVNLKRQYSVGWIANAELGGGTAEKYLGRIFGLRFTPQSRLALFGGLNNLNDTREPGSDGSWSNAYDIAGTSRAKAAGLDILVKDKRQVWKVSGNARLRHENVNHEQGTAMVRFLEGGDSYRRARLRDRTRKTDAWADADFSLRLPHAQMNFRPEGAWRRWDNRGFTQQAEFKGEPVERYRGESLDSIFSPQGSPRLEALIVNRLSQEHRSAGHIWKGGITFGSTLKIPHTPDVIAIDGGILSRRQTDRIYALDDLRYPPSGTVDRRNQYTLRPETTREAKISATYFYRFKGGMFMPSYRLSHHYADGVRTLHRLDRYAAYADGTHGLGALPSTTDSLQAAVDLGNSYHSRLRSMSQVLSGSLSLFLRQGQDNLRLIPSVRYQTERLQYNRNARDFNSTRRKVFFEPKIVYDFLDNHHFSYHYTRQQPPMTDLLPVGDDSDPLHIWKGNENLRNSARHNFSLRSRWTDDKRNADTRLEANYVLTRRAVGMLTRYDRATGVTTSQPMNIDGNWQADIMASHVRPLDRKQQLTLTLRTDAAFINSVDFVAIEGSLRTPRSSVQNLRLTQDVKLHLRLGKVSLGARINAAWTYAYSRREDFGTVSAIDLQSGLTASAALPWKLALSTDLTLYTRRGYADRSMNTDDLVWNARLSRSFWGGRLVVSADGFDLLGQLANVRRSLNAQGRTETWYNTLPRYAMLRLLWKLNREPKKK